MSSGILFPVFMAQTLRGVDQRERPITAAMSEPPMYPFRSSFVIVPSYGFLCQPLRRVLVLNHRGKGENRRGAGGELLREIRVCELAPKLSCSIIVSAGRF